MTAWVMETVLRTPQASMTLVLVWTCIVVAIAAAGIFAWYAAKKRRRSLRERAARLGFTYVPDDNMLVDRLEDLGDPFNCGFGRRVSNVLTGSWQGRPVIAADYSYKTHAGRATNPSTTRHVGVVCVQAGRALPPLSVLPEAVICLPSDSLFDNDIQVDNNEFNRTFTVSSAQPNTAGEMLNTAMVDFLLFHPHEGLKIDGERVVRLVPGHLRPEHLQPALDYLEAVLDRIPEQARRDLRASDQG